jgi:hypothetical protein
LIIQIESQSNITSTSIFQQVDNPSNELIPSTVHSSSKTPYHILQRALILNNYVDIDTLLTQHISQTHPQYIQDTLRSSPFSPAAENRNSNNAVTLFTNDHQFDDDTYLLFSVHLYLYFHPECPHQQTINSYGSMLINAYIKYLIEHKKVT